MKGTSKARGLEVGGRKGLSPISCQRSTTRENIQKTLFNGEDKGQKKSTGGENKRLGNQEIRSNTKVKCFIGKSVLSEGPNLRGKREVTEKTGMKERGRSWRTRKEENRS